MLNLHTTTEELSDGSEVSDVWLVDGQSKLGCVFHACSEKDALVLQAELLRLIASHTTDQAREC